jgi:hypothetical protein
MILDESERLEAQRKRRDSKYGRLNKVKRPWTKDEDMKLKEWVETNGPRKWTKCACVAIANRSGKQCRDRWLDYLNPALKKGEWTSREDSLILQWYRVYGAAWVKIANHVPGRSGSAVKNRFYCKLSKTLSADEKAVCKSKPQDTRQQKVEETDNPLAVETSPSPEPPIPLVSPPIREPTHPTILPPVTPALGSSLHLPNLVPPSSGFLFGHVPKKLPTSGSLLQSFMANAGTPRPEPRSRSGFVQGSIFAHLENLESLVRNATDRLTQLELMFLELLRNQNRDCAN